MVAAGDLDNDILVLYTMSGRSARVMAMNRPDAQIYAFTPSEKTVRLLQLEWGIQPLLMEPCRSESAMVEKSLAQLKKMNCIRKNHNVIFVLERSDRSASLKIVRA